MKSCALCGVAKPLDQFYKRAGSPDGYRHDCKECVKARVKKRFYAEHDKCKESLRSYHASKIKANPNWYAEAYAANREKSLTASKAYYAKNSIARIEKQKRWAEENPSKVRTYKRAWKKANPGAVLEDSARRRLAYTKQTPAWADAERTRAYYDVCSFFNEVNGYTKYHVDHIIPLRGKRVSGLHVHTNLRVIPARENERKNNKFEV